MRELPVNEIICGDCIEVMKGFPDNSIDCVVTDPPYGIGFMGKEWDKALPPKEAFQGMFRILKPGALAFVMSSPRQDVLWRMLKMLEECGFQLRQSFMSWIYKTGFPKAYDVSKGIDKKLGKKRKKVVATGGLSKNRNLNDDNWKKIGQDNPSMESNEAISELAQKWNGWKSITGLKPALECILMVNKPFSEKTIVDNVLKHGTGVINVDACRIPFQSLSDKEGAKTVSGKGTHGNNGWGMQRKEFNPTQGRFPANLIISDKALDAGKITKSTGGNQLKRQEAIFGNVETKTCCPQGYGDVGDQSRYFDLDAWARHHGFLDVPKASKKERNEGLENVEPKEKTDIFGKSEHENKEVIDRLHGQKKRLNYHPTVKPIKLMAYLIKLGCQPDGIMFDPFVGSGTSCVAAKKLGRKWIGIDTNPQYCHMTRKRINTIPARLDFFLLKKEV